MAFELEPFRFRPYCSFIEKAQNIFLLGQSYGRIALRFLRWLPFREVIFCVIILQIMGERYPFSNFPMFSSLGSKSVWYQVENDRQELLPYVTCFRFRASYLSKALRRERNDLRKTGMDEDEALRQASQTLLAYLLERATPELKDDLAAGGLHLVEVTVFVENDRLEERRRVLATLQQP